METLIRGTEIPLSPTSSNTAGNRTSFVKQCSALIVAPFLAIPMVTGAYAGSGGAITSETYAHKNQWVYDASINAKAGRAIEVETVSERLKRIQSTFGLTITDMAFLFDVSRPTVYAWIEGQEPKQEFFARIQSLNDKAILASAYELPRMNKLVRRSLNDGYTLLQRIKDGGEIQGSLDELQAIANAESRRRQQRKGLQIPKRSAEETIAQHSIPADFRS